MVENLISKHLKTTHSPSFQTLYESGQFCKENQNEGENLQMFANLEVWHIWLFKSW